MRGPRATAYAAARVAHRFPLRPTLAVGVVAVLGNLMRLAGWETGGARVLTAAAVGLALIVVWWWLRHVARPHNTKALIRRRSELDQHTGGVATRLDIAEHVSATALRRRAHILRPSYRARPRWHRWVASPRTLGVEVARLGWGLWGERVWSSSEDATLRIGGPRTGKSLSLACHGLDAPGALITTSTRLDLAEMVHQARSAHARVHIFNPADLGALGSTVRWRVLAGCESFITAQRRAADLVPESFGEGERWDAQARRVLALLLHAAALSDRSMRDVIRWVSDPTFTARDEVIDALLLAGAGGKERAAAIRAFWATNERTRTSVTTTMALPLAWMSDDRARELGDADPDDPGLVDVTAILVAGETLHLIGHEDNTALSPLIGALVAEIAHAARTLAGTQPGGRLDPPVTMLLDEAALVCPVPLDRWTADMGGRGVTLHISVQSLSQLRQRWSDHGADTILANVATLLVFGGSPSAGDLRDLSLLTGEHRMRLLTPDHGATVPADAADPAYKWMPVLSAAGIRSLEPGQVLVLRRGLAVIVAWAPLVTQRRNWRQVDLLDVMVHQAGQAAVVEMETELRRVTTPDIPRQGGHSTNNSTTDGVHGEQRGVVRDGDPT